MKKFFLICLGSFVLCFFGHSQIPKPGKTVNKPVLLKNATIHIGNGSSIDRGTVLIEQNKIAWVGNASEFKQEPEKEYIIHDISGKHLYPGFINLNNTLGITEIDAVRASRDFKETGDLNPSVRALIAFNCESRIIPTVRSNGVLITQATPRGGLISGQSAIMRLDCWNWEDGYIKSSDGIHLNWPKTYSSGGWWAEPKGMKKNKKKEEEIRKLNSLFESAKQVTNNPDNLKLTSVNKLFDGSLNLYIHSNRTSEIMESVEFAKKHGVKNIVLVGGAESYKLTEYLKVNNVSVILKRVHSLPDHKHDLLDQHVRTAKILSDQQIPYALSWSGNMEAMNSRNLPFGAGQTVAMGVDYEQAVASITLEAAKIVGIEKQYGSIETGKSATLFVSNGDALEMMENKVVMAFVDGRPLDLDNPQKYLYRKYSEKHGLEINDGQ